VIALDVLDEGVGDLAPILVRLEPFHRRGAVRDDLLRIVSGNASEGVEAFQLRQRLDDCVFEVSFEVFLDEVRNDFRICLSYEAMVTFSQTLLQGEIILDNAVVYYYYPTGAVAMRVGIFLGWTSVSGPSSVTNTVGSIDWT